MALRARGNELFKDGSFEEAVATYSRAIEEEGDSAALRSNRSAASVGLKHFAAALEDADAALSLQPGWSKAFYRRGVALEALSRLPEAAAAFREGTLAANTESEKAACSECEDAIHRKRGRPIVQ